jgi:nucleotide-binding universal stress UspA family protein
VLFRRDPMRPTPSPRPSPASPRAATVRGMLPAVVVIEGDPALLEQCVEASLEMAVTIVPTDLAEAEAVIASRQPFVILTSTRVFERASDALHRLARASDAKLVCVSARTSCTLLRVLLASAQPPPPALH